MSKDTLEFLKNKFMDDLREAKEDEHLPHLSLFKDIQGILIKGQSECSPDCMENCLNQLNIIFSDCIISLENSKIQRKKDPFLGHCHLPDRTRDKLLDIRKKLIGRKCKEMDQTRQELATQSEGIYQDPQEIDRQSKEIYRILPEMDRQGVEIEHLLAAASDRDEGIVGGIGIVGLGGPGKTLVAKKIFSNHPNDYRIFFDLVKIQKGKVDFEKILRDILKLFPDESHKFMNHMYNSGEELLEEVQKVLGSTRKYYLVVFDGIWDINIDWYFKLKEILRGHNESKQDQNSIIIITTRFPAVAKRMVGSQNLYHMQPISDEANWKLLEESN